jgi:hypothetical protein
MADPQYVVRKFRADAARLYVGGVWYGPSIGGYTHDPGANWRAIDGDGITTEMAGDQRVTGFNTHLRARMKDMTAQMLAYLQPGSTSDGSNGSQGGNQIVPTTARVFFTEDDLIKDVRLVYRTHDPDTGLDGWDAIIYPLMRPENSPLSGEDNNEAIHELDWKAILLKSQSRDEPPYFEVQGYNHDTFDIDNYVTYETP